MRKPLERVLFVGGGRRVSLARMFRERGIDVWGYELDPGDVPLNVEIGPHKILTGLRWGDEGLEKDLFQKMLLNRIDFAIPLQDEAVKVLSQFETLPSVCSPAAAAETCYDKQKFAEFCSKHFPNNYPDLSLRYNTSTGFTFPETPAVIRPRFGYGSNDLHIFESIQDATRWAKGRNPLDWIETRFIEGKEYTVDTYTDRKGNIRCVSPRLRERVAGGEVVDSTIVNHPCLIELIYKVVEQLEIVGPACTQVIIEKGTNDIYLIECNARFGGGTVLSIHAGLDMIEMIKEEYPHNDNPNLKRHCQWQVGHKMRRYFSEHYV